MLPDGLLNTIKRHFPQVSLKRRNYKKIIYVCSHVYPSLFRSVHFYWLAFHCGVSKGIVTQEGVGTIEKTHVEVSSSITLKRFIF